MSTHIESNINDIAKTVLMPGDPKRCEYIAKKFLSNAKIINNVRGMTAYTGYYKSKQITVFPSGMGIPSVGIYSYELYNIYDVEEIIRIGTSGSNNKNLTCVYPSFCSFIDAPTGFVYPCDCSIHRDRTGKNNSFYAILLNFTTKFGSIWNLV